VNQVEIKFTIYGIARPKGGAHTVTKGGRTWGYVPTSVRDWEDTIRAQVHNYRPPELLKEALKLEAHFYRAPLKSFSNKKRELALTGIIRPATSPDLDKCVRALQDAITGIIFGNDSIIVDLVSSKWYGDPPRVEVIISNAD